jgi:hypothetical protein
MMMPFVFSFCAGIGAEMRIRLPGFVYSATACNPGGAAQPVPQEVLGLTLIIGAHVRRVEDMSPTAEILPAELLVCSGLLGGRIF